MKSINNRPGTWTMILVGLMLAFTWTGCGTAPDSVAPTITEADDVQASAELIRTTVGEFLGLLPENAIASGNKMMVRGAALDFVAARFGGNSVEYWNTSQVFAEWDDPDLRQIEAPEVSTHLQLVASLADEALATAASSSDYINQLRKLERQVLADSGTDPERLAAMSYLIVLEETTSYFAELQGPDKISWRCAASVLGGAVLGGFTGAGGGSVIPGIGTGVGGVIGVIAGGAIGWASGC